MPVIHTHTIPYRQRASMFKCFLFHILIWKFKKVLNVGPIPPHQHAHTAPALVTHQAAKRQGSLLTIELMAGKIKYKMKKNLSQNRNNNTEIEITRKKDLEARSRRLK